MVSVDIRPNFWIEPKTPVCDKAEANLLRKLLYHSYGPASPKLKPKRLSVLNPQDGSIHRVRTIYKGIPQNEFGLPTFLTLDSPFVGYWAHSADIKGADVVALRPLLSMPDLFEDNSARVENDLSFQPDVWQVLEDNGYIAALGHLFNKTGIEVDMEALRQNAVNYQKWILEQDVKSYLSFANNLV